MIVEHVKLENYRLFRDAEIEFANPENGKNFTVICGASGYGKTSFLNAISWCLYGNEIGAYGGLSIINEKILRESSPDDVCKVKVEIRMRDVEGKLVLDRAQDSSNSSEFTVSVKFGKGWVPISGSDFIIERLIPEHIARFSFFNGKSLEEYFRESPSIDVKKAAYSIFQLDLLDKFLNNLNNIGMDFSREGSELKQIKEKFLENFRKGIEPIIKDHFMNFIWRKRTSKDIGKDNNYNASLIDQLGADVTLTLSSAERWTLALFFIMAIHHFLGLNVPIIIDSLFRGFSDEFRKTITEILPKLLEGKQVILLVTEGEYSPDVRERLSKFVGKEYQIIRDEHGDSYFKEIKNNKEQKNIE